MNVLEVISGTHRAYLREHAELRRGLLRDGGFRLANMYSPVPQIPPGSDEYIARCEERWGCAGEAIDPEVDVRFAMGWTNRMEARGEDADNYIRVRFLTEGAPASEAPAFTSALYPNLYVRASYMSPGKDLCRLREWKGGVISTDEATERGTSRAATWTKAVTTLVGADTAVILLG